MSFDVGAHVVEGTAWEVVESTHLCEGMLLFYLYIIILLTSLMQGRGSSNHCVCVCVSVCLCVCYHSSECYECF